MQCIRLENAVATHPNCNCESIAAFEITNRPKVHLSLTAHVKSPVYESSGIGDVALDEPRGLVAPRRIRQTAIEFVVSNQAGCRRQLGRKVCSLRPFTLKLRNFSFRKRLLSVGQILLNALFIARLL